MTKSELTAPVLEAIEDLMREADAEMARREAVGDNRAHADYMRAQKWAHDLQAYLNLPLPPIS